MDRVVVCRECGNDFKGNYQQHLCSDECRIKRAKKRNTGYVRHENKLKNSFVLSFSRYESSGRKRIKYLVKCDLCGGEKYVTTNVVVSAERNKKYICSSCETERFLRNNKVAGYEKKRNNTSGYIGVFIYKDWRDGKEIGYRAVITEDNKTIMKNTYKDKFISEDTLLQAVCDRDLFIIRHRLPHKRNLDDKELEILLNRLSNKQLRNIKNGVKYNG